MPPVKAMTGCVQPDVTFASRSRGASESMTIWPSDESKCVANENFGPDFSTYSPIWA